MRFLVSVDIKCIFTVSNLKEKNHFKVDTMITDMTYICSLKPRNNCAIYL